MDREGIKDEIDAISIAAEVLFELVSQRIGLVLREARNGSISEMQEMQRNSTKRSKAVAKVEVASNSREHEPVSKRARENAKVAEKALAAKRQKRKQEWWYKLTAAQKQEIIAKRVAGKKAKEAA
jgi:DNA repair protein RadC